MNIERNMESGSFHSVVWHGEKAGRYAASKKDRVYTESVFEACV